MRENVRPEEREIIPVRMLQAVGALLLITLLVVFYARLSDMPLLGVPKYSPVVKAVELNFVEKQDGSIIILDATGEKMVSSSEGPNGFISVVYNGLSYERKKKGIVGIFPVKLVQHKDGRLTIVDDVTSWDMHLNSFGAKNTEVFGKLLR